MQGEFTLPPNNIDAEQALLGALMIWNDKYFELGGLQASHFYEPVHRRIFETIGHCLSKGMLANPITLANFFEKDPDLADIGGAKYLTQVAKKAWRIIEARDYAAMILDLARRRELRDGLLEILEHIDTPRAFETSDDMVGMLFEKCMKVSGERITRIKSAREVTQNVIKDLSGPLPCFSTGIEALDSAMGGGLYVRKNYCFAARPKTGKSVLLTTISGNLALAGVPHIYVCCEMGDREVHQRFLSRQVKENSLAFYKKREDHNFVEKLLDFQRLEKETPDSLYYVDAPRIRFQELQRIVLTAIKKYNIKCVMLDYLQLVTGMQKGESKTDHMENVAGWCAQVAKEYDICVAYAAQRNRGGELRGSDAALMEADQIYELDGNAAERSAWLSMKESRYTPLQHVGSKAAPGLKMNMNGPYFTDFYEGYKTETPFI